MTVLQLHLKSSEPVSLGQLTAPCLGFVDARPGAMTPDYDASAGSRGRHSAEPTLSRMELVDRGLEVGGGEIGPPAIGEVQLGVGAFPKKKIAQTLLAAGADQEVDVTGFAVPMIDVGHRPREILTRDVPGPAQLLRSSYERVAGGVIDRDSQIESLALPGCILRNRDRPQELGGDSVAASDDSHAHIVSDTPISFGDQITSEEPHQQRYFAGRTRPVVGGESVQRQHPDPAVGCGLDDLAYDASAGNMARCARTAPRIGPASIAIHNDGDVNSGLGRRMLRGAGVRVLHCVVGV